jgi:hypothetical protein
MKESYVKDGACFLISEIHCVRIVDGVTISVGFLDAASGGGRFKRMSARIWMVLPRPTIHTTEKTNYYLTSEIYCAGYSNT